MAWYDDSQFLLKVFVSVLRIPVVGEVMWLFGFPHWLPLKSRKVNFTRLISWHLLILIIKTWGHWRRFCVFLYFPRADEVPCVTWAVKKKQIHKQNTTRWKIRGLFCPMGGQVCVTLAVKKNQTNSQTEEKNMKKCFLLFPMDGSPCVTWAVSGLAMLNLPPIRIPSMRLLFAYDQLGVQEAGIFPIKQ